MPSVLLERMVLTTYCKQQIVQLYSSGKFSYQKVSKLLAAEGLKVPVKTVWATVQRYKVLGTVSHIQGSGRRYKLNTDMIKIIEEKIQEDDETTATQMVKILEDRGYKISKTTVIRARKALGWTFHGSRYCQMLRNKNKLKRVEWAMANIGKEFEDIVWTDESMIQLDNHRAFCYRKKGAPLKPKPQPKNSYKVMVWVGISKKGATSICLINGSVNSSAYQEILKTHLLPFLQEHLPNGKFQQDNAPCHTPLSTRRFLEENGVNIFKTPPESSDLNLIENMWHEMKHYIRTNAKPRTKEELIEAICKFWSTVTPEKCARYIGHLRKVIPKVIEVNGEATGY